MLAMVTKQKLELTCIGEDRLAQLEPSILPEDLAPSSHTNHRLASADFWLSGRWLIQRAAGLLRSACPSTNFASIHIAMAGNMNGPGGSGEQDMGYYPASCCQRNVSPGITIRARSHTVIQSIE